MSAIFNIRTNVSLARYTTLKVGGFASRYFKPLTVQHLSEFIQSLPKDEQLLWLGLGSNLLIRDGGFSGTVIHLHNTFKDIQVLEKTATGMLLKIEAGVSCARIAKFCTKHGLSGGFFAGIPGTMGGALAMNAGAFDSETWQYVVAVEAINRDGKICTYERNNYDVGYRKVIKPEQHWFVAGHLFFNYAKGVDMAIKQLLAKRAKLQPIGTFNCGSVFKNPPKMHAAQLIDAAKLKGCRKGDAMVSSKHANFIINLGNATAQEVEDLIYFMQQQVWSLHKVHLEPEVQIVGSPA